MAGASGRLAQARSRWSSLPATVGEAAYFACAALALPAMLTALVMGEPPRHREPVGKPGIVADGCESVWKPFAEFFQRQGALLVLLFILLHKIGDTLANLTFRLLFDDLGFTNDEIAIYDVGRRLLGLSDRHIHRRHPLRAARHEALGADQPGTDGGVQLQLRAAGGRAATATSGWPARSALRTSPAGSAAVTVVAYFSALCDLRFTAAQYALISAAASIVGRFLTGTTAGALIEGIGYVNFYLLTTVAAVPGIILFWVMMRMGLIDRSIGTAGTEGSGDVRAKHPDEERPEKP